MGVERSEKLVAGLTMNIANHYLWEVYSLCALGVSQEKKDCHP